MSLPPFSSTSKLYSTRSSSLTLTYSTFFFHSFPHFKLRNHASLPLFSSTSLLYSTGSSPPSLTYSTFPSTHSNISNLKSFIYHFFSTYSTTSFLSTPFHLFLSTNLNTFHFSVHPFQTQKTNLFHFSPLALHRYISTLFHVFHSTHVYMFHYLITSFHLHLFQLHRLPFLLPTDSVPPAYHITCSHLQA